MRRTRLLLAASTLALAVASPAYAGTVPIPVAAQATPVNSCTAGPNPDPLWPLVVQANTSPAACDVRVSFAAVPASRAGDIVSAHGVATLFGVSGFELGVLANDGSIAGSVGVPTGDNIVESSESGVPLSTTGGTVTLVLRSATGTGEAWMAAPATRSLIVRVSDNLAPTVQGRLGTVPANALIPASVTVGARLSDNGPTVAGAASTINWGDSTTVEDVSTIAPLNPFTASLTTTTAQHVYFVPGTYTIGIVARDSAGNARNGTLGALRVWDVPAATETPRITGRLRRSSRLTCQAGPWTQVGGPTPFTYRWLRSATVIASATARSYVLRAADRDKQLSCIVSAHNPAGGAAAARAANRRFWVKPALRTRPRLSGRPRVGSTIACTQGRWRWSPQGFKYTWLRNGIATKTHRKRLKLASNDTGKRLACRVTASNSAGRASATTRSVTVKAKPPKKTGGGGGGGGAGCDPSYPTVCIPPPPPDLDCGDIPYRNFPVVGSDPHGFDGDNDGIGCES